MIFYEPVARPRDAARAAGFVERDAEDAIAHLLFRPHFCSDRETALLAGFDSYGRLLRLEATDTDDRSRCTLPPECWRQLLGDGFRTAVIAHNHPSGIAWPSRADLDATRQAATLLRGLAIDLTDHLVFVDHGHFSFRRAGLL